MLILEERPPFVNRMLEEYKIRYLQVPRLRALHDETPPNYPFNKNLKGVRHGTGSHITYLYHHSLSQAKCSDSWLGSTFWEAMPVDPAY